MSNFDNRSMSAPSPLPKFVYKILPATSVYFGCPIPIPSDWEFPKPEADLKDGFVHLSTRCQLPSTLKRFFASDASVQLLKVDYPRMSTWKIVEWEKASNGDSYAHLYGTLTGEIVTDIKVVSREEGWESICKKLEEIGWLQN